MRTELRRSDEARLLERLLVHDPSAWNDWVREVSPLLLAMAHKTFAAYAGTASHPDAEDAVAQVWEQILKDDCRLIRRGLEKGHFLQTLMVMVRNRAIDILRARRLPTVPFADQVPVPEERPSTADEWPVELLRPALETLSPREKAVVRLFFLQGRKYREIADVTGIPQNSIGPTLGRALLKLRPIVQQLAASRASGKRQ